MKEVYKFCSSLLKKNKKDIRSILLSENMILILAGKNKTKIKKAAEALKAKTKINLKFKIVPLEEYFKMVLKGDHTFYSKVSQTNILYDPEHFVDPIKDMVKKGNIIGTKESLLRKFIGIRSHFREIDATKHAILNNIYMCTVEIAQSVLMEKYDVICPPTQVPKYIKHYLIKKNKISQRYLAICTEIIKTFKDLEHKKKTLLTGKEIDLLEKKAHLFLDRMEEILSEK